MTDSYRSEMQKAADFLQPLPFGTECVVRS